MQAGLVNLHDPGCIAKSRMNFKIALFVGFFMMLVSDANGAIDCPPGIKCRMYICCQSAL